MLQQLALMVRGADTSLLDLTPQSSGLFAISLGLSSIFPDDQEMPGHGMNTAQAMPIVASPSRLSSSAADEAGVVVRPSMSSSGPVTPPANTTNAIEPQSSPPSGASARERSRSAQTSARPRPDPR